MIQSIQISIRLVARTLFICLCLATPAALAQAAQYLEAMRAADARLAEIGFRLSTAAATLCDRQEPGIGIQLHTLAQYAPATRNAVRAHFAMSRPIGVEAVVPGSPADRAGVRPDDAIVRLSGITLPATVSDSASSDALAALHGALTDLAPEAPIEVVIERAGRQLSFRILPTAACRTRYELRIANEYDARANGELVQVSSKYMEAVDPALLPAVVAHELAHNILRHRERLREAGADFGLASGFGRNVGFFRQTEIEADIFSVHLLARAGYPPELAARFWEEAGPALGRGQLRSRSHPPRKDRIATTRAEARRIAAGDAPLPGFYHARVRPLDANWQALLPPAKR
jgi:hypothetical protein